jgi:hypothetical protein
MAYPGGAAANNVIAQANMATSMFIVVDPENFNKILARAGKTVVITGKGGYFQKNYWYLTYYMGFKYFTKSNTEMILPGNVEIITAKTSWFSGRQ